VTVTTSSERRAAAELRRRAAGEAGERGGDAAYRAYRAAVPGVGAARRVPTSTVLLANTEVRDGKELVHTSGFFCRYGVAYPMWDQFGEYHERVASGAGASTIAAKPDVAFLVNHGGVTMARTTNGSLELDERPEGGHHDAWLNPKRQDVSDLVVAIQDGHVDQMSFAFMIPDGEGLWSEDFTEFEIRSYDMNRGDVSAVNYGASPYTDISARSSEILHDLERLPEGAMRAAAARLVRRGMVRPESGAGTPRERIEVAEPREHVEPVVVATRSATSMATKRLASRKSRTAARFVDLAQERNLSVAELVATALPWYEVRNADGDPQERGEEEGVATVFIFDEIGGSFGVDSKTFAQELEGITAPDIKVRINSPGGSVFDGIAIHSALLHHPSVVATYVDGLAASAASVIAMAADPYDPSADRGGVRAMPGGEMMLHLASMTQDGNPVDMDKAKTFLWRQSENLASMYAGKSGMSTEECLALMEAETWLFGHEGVELGLIDAVVERKMPVAGERMAKLMKRKFDLSARRYAGRRDAPDPVQLRGQIRHRAAAGERITIPERERQARAAGLPEVADAGRSTANARGGRSIADIEALLSELDS
jgi:HK97 family phage prohead protease